MAEDVKRDSTAPEQETAPSPAVAEGPNPDMDVVAMLGKFRNETVPKQVHDKLASDYNKLVRAVASGEVGNYQPTEQTAPIPTMKDLREAVQRHDQTNLEYWSNQLALREALVSSGKRDPWVSRKQINGYQVTQKDAEEQAETIAEIIELSDGDDAMFDALMNQALRNGGHNKGGYNGRM